MSQCALAVGPSHLGAESKIWGVAPDRETAGKWKGDSANAVVGRIHLHVAFFRFSGFVYVPRNSNIRLFFLFPHFSCFARPQNSELGFQNPGERRCLVLNAFLWSWVGCVELPLASLARRGLGRCTNCSEPLKGH